MTPSPAAIAEYGEQIASFLRRGGSKTENLAALQQHANSLFNELKSLLPALKDSPEYAGVAFYGRFQAVNLRLIKKLSAPDVSAVDALAAVREAKALRVAASAKAGWDLLMQNDPDALWTAIYLNLCTAPVNVRVAKAAASDEEGEAHDEDGDDEEDDEPDTDDDDDAN